MSDEEKIFTECQAFIEESQVIIEWQAIIDSRWDERELFWKQPLKRLQEFISVADGIGAQNERKETPLHHAVRHSENAEVIKELINAGADVNAKEADDWTPLHYAAQWNPSIEVIRELIKAGADASAKNNAGKTPYDLLSYYSTLKDDKEAKELLSRGKTSSDDNDEHEMPSRNGLGEKGKAKIAIKNWIEKPKPKIARLWGYAGTGKTTFIQSLKFDNIKPRYCAFTGKAASVMRQKGMKNATTIHGLIYNLDRKTINDEHGDEDLIFKLRSYKNLLDLVIVDECSMVNEEIGRDLLRVTEKLLVLGDQGQLPPIEGTGFFNRDDLDAIDLEFTEIHRQEENSPILDFATRARLGQEIKESNDPACMVKVGSTQDAINSLHEKGDIIICWRRKTKHEFNQEALKRQNLKKRRLMEGMQVVCSQNNRHLHLWNGTIWTVKKTGKRKQHTDGKIEKDYLTAECILIDDEGNEKQAHLINSSFGKDNFDMSHLKNKNHAAFDYGYAITCHKAQGSQWERVAIYVDMPRGFDDYNQWLYTAATRAQKSLYVLFANA